MGRNRKAQGTGLMSGETSAWIPEYDEILGLKQIGRRNTSVRFLEMRLKNRCIEMDYQFNSGGGQLTGTMVIAYTHDEPIGMIVEKLTQFGEEAFHNIRRSRD